MKPIRTIVTATDLSEASNELLSSAQVLGDQLGARIQVVHVVHDLSRYMGFYVGTTSLRELQESIEQEAHKRLDELCSAEFGEREGVAWEVIKGTPFADLVAHVEQVGADLIMVAAHGQSKPEHKIFGSVAERLVKHAPCPVLVVGQR